MKAWKVSNIVKENIEPEIIYANDSKGALLLSELYYDAEDFSDILAEHMEYADDKEDLSQGYFIIMLLENGWEYKEFGVFVVDTECSNGFNVEVSGKISLTKDDIEGLKDFGFEEYLMYKLNKKVEN